jgi:hypothetical protein
MRLVAVATHSERYFPLLLASCRRFGAELHVLCWEEKWRGYAQKLTAMLDYLATLPEDEVVCMVDAFDTILLQPLDVLEERFRKSGAKMIIAADGEPPNAVIRYFVHRVFPPVDGTYTNSGTYVGYAGHLRRLIKQVMTAGYTSQNDQEMIARFCSTHEGWITVDKQSEFFLTFYAGSSWSLSNELATSVQGAGVEIVRSTRLDKHAGLRWRPTGTVPFVLHAPCDGNINAIVKELGYDLPDSILNYGSADHAKYIWRATKTYMPLIWDQVLLMVLLIVLAIVALYFLARFIFRRASAQAPPPFVAPQQTAAPQVAFLSPPDPRWPAESPYGFGAHPFRGLWPGVSLLPMASTWPGVRYHG